jgi:ABC-type multidrug transport system ATPase subunit
LGLTAAEVAERTEAIVAFSGIGDAVGAPVKQYSTGMAARLGLAIAVHADPQLLLVDEALAVGDRGFQTHAIKAMQALVAQGTTTVFVSHDYGLVEEFCTRVVRLAEGRVVDDGPASDVIDRAGGTGWDGGVKQVTTAIRIDEMTLTPRHIQAGGTFEFEGIVEVTEPCPTVRLEFSNVVRDREEPGTRIEPDKRQTFVTKVVEPAGGRISEPGRYRFSGSVGENHYHGSAWVVITAIDEREGTLLAEAWQPIRVGSRVQSEPVTIVLDADWETEPERDRRSA